MNFPLFAAFSPHRVKEGSSWHKWVFDWPAQIIWAIVDIGLLYVLAEIVVPRVWEWAVDELEDWDWSFHRGDLPDDACARCRKDNECDTSLAPCCQEECAHT